MKSIFYERLGDPAKVLYLKECGIPEPGPDEVVVKLKYVPINRFDIHQIRGIYGASQKLPSVPGHEGIGQIVRIGSRVTGLREGDWVMRTLTELHSAGQGTWQEYACWTDISVFPAQHVTDLVTASIVPSIILPAYVMAIHQMKLQHGQTLLVTAGASIFSKIIVQLAKVAGFSVISVVRRPVQVEEIKQMGALDVIVSSTQDITQRALELTGGKGVDAVIDLVGGEVATKCFDALAKRGVMTMFGLMDEKRMSVLNMNKLVADSLTVNGYWQALWWFDNPNPLRYELVERCFELINQKKLSLEAVKFFPIDRFQEAIRGAEEPGGQGRIFLEL